MSLEMQAHPPRNTQTHTHTHINVKIFASSLSGAGATNCSDSLMILHPKKSTLDISNFKIRPLFFFLFFSPKGKVTACTGLYV